MILCQSYGGGGDLPVERIAPGDDKGDLAVSRGSEERQRGTKSGNHGAPKRINTGRTDASDLVVCVCVCMVIARASKDWWWNVVTVLFFGDE